MAETFTPAQVVAVLESGDYQRAKARLLDEHGRRCCLGVMCDMAGVPDHQIFGKATVQQIDSDVFYEAFPWVRGMHRDSSVGSVEGVLMGANDDMDEDNRTYDGPIAILDQLIQQETGA